MAFVDANVPKVVEMLVGLNKVKQTTRELLVGRYKACVTDGLKAHLDALNECMPRELEERRTAMMVEMMEEKNHYHPL